MKKLLSISLLIVFVTGSVVGGCAAPAPEVIKLKFGTKWPMQHPLVTEDYELVLKEMKEKSDGRIDYEIYASGALAGPTEDYDAVRVGKLDIAQFNPDITPGRFPLSDVLSLPISFPDAKTVTTVSLPVFDRILSQEYTDTHTFSVWRVENFFYIGNKEVRTLEDLKGLKLRTTGGIITRTLKALGVTPITMGIGDLYLSLETGVIDGAITGATAIPPFKLHEVVKYITEFSFGATTEGMTMNKDAWERIPDDLKPIVEAAGRRAGILSGEFSDRNIPGSIKLFTDAGGTIYRLTPEEYQRWNEALRSVAEEWVAEMEAKGLPGGKALDIYREESLKKGVVLPF